MFDNTAFSFFWLDMIVRLKCCLEIGISNEYVFRRFLGSTSYINKKYLRCYDKFYIIVF